MSHHNPEGILRMLDEQTHFDEQQIDRMASILNCLPVLPDATETRGGKPVWSRNQVKDALRKADKVRGGGNFYAS